MPTIEHTTAWQHARTLADEVYAQFGISFDIDYENQTCSAATLLSKSLAQSFGEEDKGGQRYSLLQARGYCGDLAAMVRSGIKLKKITPEKAEILIEKCDELSDLIRVVMKQYG